MVFSYQKQYLKEKFQFALSYLIVGAIFSIWGGYTFIFVFVVPGILSGILYFYWKNKGYVKIDSTSITKYKFIPKTLNWEQLEGMRYYTNSIKLIGANTTIDIDKQYLSNEDLKRLEQEIKSRLPINQS